MGETTSETVEAEGAGIVCPDCGVTVQPRGKTPLALALGLHRRTEHGVMSTKKAERAASAKRTAQRRKAKAVALDAEPETVTQPGTLHVLRQAGEAAGRGKRAPDADSLSAGMGRLYGYASYFAWSLIVDGDPRLSSEAQRDEVAMMLAASGPEAVATVRPFARLAARSAINKRYGADFIENLDVADALAAIGDQVRRARQYLAGRNEGAQLAAPTNGAYVPPTGADGVPPNPMNGGYMGPTHGVVVDANMVAEMRGAPRQTVTPEAQPAPMEAPSVP